MKANIAILALAAATAWAAQQGFTAHYLNVGLTGQSKCLALDANGNSFVVSVVTEPSGRTAIRVTKLDPSGKTLASLDFGGSGGDAPAAAIADAQGNLIIAGTTTSADFPVTSVLSRSTGSPAFVTKVDANLAGIVASVEFGGTVYPSTLPDSTVPGGLALDAAGNVYVAGATAAQDFPVTAGAYQASPNGDYNGFLVELPAALNRFVFATYLGQATYLNPEWRSATAITIANDGSILLAGGTGGGIPVTPDAYAQKGAGGDGFVAKLAPGGGSIIWATYIPIQFGGPMFNSVVPYAIALDSSGNVAVAGWTSAILPVTSGAFQSQFLDDMDGFVLKLDALGQHLLFCTYFGGDMPVVGVGVNGAVLDSTGNIWITGNSQAGILPGSSSQPGESISFVAALSPDGTSVTALYPALPGAAGAAIASGPKGIASLGANGSLLLPAPPSTPALMTVENAAGSTASGVIAPAELVTLYGSNLGPAMALGPQVSNNVVASSLDGYQLLFNGVPAPLLNIAANQINAVVPLEVEGHDTATLQLVTPQGTVPLTTLFVAPAQPAIFRDVETGYAAAVNQDGTLNSRTNPAPPGTVVTVWATGTGVGPIAPSPADGALLQTCTLCLFPEPPAIIAYGTSYGVASETVYAGIAPGDVYGVAQINFRVPVQNPPVAEIQLSVGSALSDSVQIYVGQ